MGGHLGQFLKVFLPSKLTHTKPCLNWMFSFCTLKTRPASSYDTHTDSRQRHTLSLYMGFFIVNTTHHTKHLQYVSVTNNVLCCTNDVFLYSFPRYTQMNSMNIWWFFSKQKNRYTLTVISCTSFFFSYPMCVETAFVLVVKWCLLTNCVLVLLLFDSVCSLDLLQSDQCDWKTLEASGCNWIKIFWQLFVSRCHRVFSHLPSVQRTLRSITFYDKTNTQKSNSAVVEYD